MWTSPYRGLELWSPLNDLSLRQGTTESELFRWGVGWGITRTSTLRVHCTGSLPARTAVRCCMSCRDDYCHDTGLHPATDRSCHWGEEKKIERPWCTWEVVSRKGCKKYTISRPEKRRVRRGEVDSRGFRLQAGAKDYLPGGGLRGGGGGLRNCDFVVWE